MFTTVILRIGAFAGSLSISLTEAALGLLILAAMYKVYKTRDYNVFSKGFFIFFLLMVLAETISTFAGVDPKRSINDFFSWWPLLYLPAVYILFEGRNKIVYLLYVFAGACLASFYGAVQFFQGDKIDGRSMGFFSHALTYGNVLAMVCITALGVLFFYSFQKKAYKYATAAALLISFCGLMTSASRGPILALIISAFMMVIYRFRWKGFVAGIVAIAILGTVVMQIDTIRVRFEYMLKNTKVTTSSMGSRLVLWEASSEAIMMRPIFGYGKRNFKSEVSKYITVPTLSRAHAHNAYIQYTFLHGFFGLFAMLGFLSAIMLEIFKRMSSNPFAKTAFFLLIVFLLEGVTENHFTDTEVTMMFCSLMGLMLAPGRSAINVDPDPDEEELVQ